MLPDKKVMCYSFWGDEDGLSIEVHPACSCLAREFVTTLKISLSRRSLSKTGMHAVHSFQRLARPELLERHSYTDVRSLEPRIRSFDLERASRTQAVKLIQDRTRTGRIICEKRARK